MGAAITALALPEVIAAQVVASNVAARSDTGPADAAEPADTSKIGTRAPSYIVRPTEIQYYRPTDQRGINVFESPKEAGVAYTGFKLNFGGAFTQQFQSLDHSNTAAPKVVGGVDANELMDIGSGFNNE